MLKELISSVLIGSTFFAVQIPPLIPTTLSYETYNRIVSDKFMYSVSKENENIVVNDLPHSLFTFEESSIPYNNDENFLGYGVDVHFEESFSNNLVVYVEMNYSFVDALCWEIIYYDNSSDTYKSFNANDFSYDNLGNVTIESDTEQWYKFAYEIPLDNFNYNDFILCISNLDSDHINLLRTRHFMIYNSIGDDSDNNPILLPFLPYGEILSNGLSKFSLNQKYLELYNQYLSLQTNIETLNQLLNAYQNNSYLLENAKYTFHFDDSLHLSDYVFDMSKNNDRQYFDFSGNEFSFKTDEFLESQNITNRGQGGELHIQFTEKIDTTYKPIQFYVGSEDSRYTIYYNSVNPKTITYDSDHSYGNIYIQDLNDIYALDVFMGYDLGGGGFYVGSSETIGYLKAKNELLPQLNLLENQLKSYNGETYNEIYKKGYNNGLKEGDFEKNGFKAMINEIFSFPINMIKKSLNFSIFGINLASTIFFIISISLVLWLVKRLWK